MVVIVIGTAIIIALCFILAASIDILSRDKKELKEDFDQLMIKYNALDKAHKQKLYEVTSNLTGIAKKGEIWMQLSERVYPISGSKENDISIIKMSASEEKLTAEIPISLFMKHFKSINIS